MCFAAGSYAVSTPRLGRLVSAIGVHIGAGMAFSTAQVAEVRAFIKPSNSRRKTIKVASYMQPVQ